MALIFINLVKNTTDLNVDPEIEAEYNTAESHPNMELRVKKNKP